MGQWNFSAMNLAGLTGSKLFDPTGPRLLYHGSYPGTTGRERLDGKAPECNTVCVAVTASNGPSKPIWPPVLKFRSH